MDFRSIIELEVAKFFVQNCSIFKKIDFFTPASTVDVNELYVVSYITDASGEIVNADQIPLLEAVANGPLNTDNVLTAADIDLSVYPNPATDFIQLDGNLDQVESIQIANTQGQIVKQINRLNGNTINIGALQTGMYIISIQQKDKIGTLRIFKD